MNAYLLKRVAGFALVFLGVELVASLAWWAFHRGDRRVVSELSPRIEEAWDRIGEQREWLDARRALGDSLDAVSDRLAAGAAAFADRAALDSARARQTRRIRAWNAGLAEHERRRARLDSLVAARDRLIESWMAAYRRAYPGWLLLPRPAPPRPAAPESAAARDVARDRDTEHGVRQGAVWPP